MEERKGSSGLNRETVQRWRAFQPEDVITATARAKNDAISAVSGGDRNVVSVLRGLFRRARTPNQVSVKLRDFNLPQK